MLYVNPQSESAFRSSSLTPGSKGRETEALKQFEQVFLFEMLKEMRKTVPDSALFESGGQKAYFEEMMDDFLAGEMASSGQLGVATQMAQQLHAREKAAMAADTRKALPGVALPDHAGIAIKRGHDGIAIPGETPTGIAVKQNTMGIAMKPLHSTGISLSRAHESYRTGE